MTAKEIAAEIAALPRPDNPSVRVVRKRWSATLKTAEPAAVIALARTLELDTPQEQKWAAYELIRFHPGAFAAISQAEIEDFAERLASWYATDGFGTTLTGPLWAKGRLPDALFDAWSVSENRWLRRSALVATVGRNAALPGRKGDPARTFALCLRLAADRDDMVEKAVSWALRFLIPRDKPAVEAFMAEHGPSFRPRVRREVAHKLTTGLKTPRASA